MPKFTIRTHQQLSQAVTALSELNIEGKPYTLELKRLQDKRTLSQNALYWKWVSELSAEYGNSPKATHEALKEEFCPTTLVKMGDLEKTVRSTADLKTDVMTEYMNQIRAHFATEMGFFLTLPEEQHRH